MERRTPGWLVFVVLLVIVLVTRLILPPHISSDSTSYLEAMKVLVSGEAPPGFVPYRILTTFFGMESVITLGYLVTGDILVAWYVVNSIFFILGLAAFFFFLRDFFEREVVAWLGTLLLAINYVTVSFGLNYLMDMGGWAFFLISLWSTYRYYKTGRTGYLVASALSVGCGGLFKEYAFLGAIPLFGMLMLRDWKKPRVFWGNAVQALTLIVIPAALLFSFVSASYGYTYADWFSLNQARYGESYTSRIVEYIKVFGSLFTFAWFLALPGFYLLIRKGRELLGTDRLWFMSFLFVAGLPVFLWPAITQRIFFVSVVFLVMLSCVVFKKYERFLPYMLPLILLYVIAGYTMDAYILPAVNISALFS